MAYVRMYPLAGDIFTIFSWWCECSPVQRESFVFHIHFQQITLKKPYKVSDPSEDIRSLPKNFEEDTKTAGEQVVGD